MRDYLMGFNLDFVASITNRQYEPKIIAAQ